MTLKNVLLPQFSQRWVPNRRVFGNKNEIRRLMKRLEVFSDKIATLFVPILKTDIFKYVEITSWKSTDDT